MISHKEVATNRPMEVTAMYLAIRRPRRLARRRDTFERWFDGNLPWRPLGLTPAGLLEHAWIPAIDVRETDDAVIVEAAISGFKPEDVSVSYEDGSLVLSGAHEQASDDEAETDKDQDGYLVRERRAGRFHRRIRLPVRTTTENATARYENGVLTIEVPKAPEAKSTSIKVEAQ